MNLAVLISTASAASAISLGLVALVVGRARAWSHLRWFAGVAFASAAYGMGNIATCAGLAPRLVIIFSHVQTAAALVELVCWLGYTDALIGFRAGRIERGVRLLLLAFAALALVPGVAFSGEVLDRPFPPWSLVYHEAVTTPVGSAFFVIGVGGGALLVIRLWRAWRRGARQGFLLTVSVLVVVLFATSDLLGALRIYSTPYLLDVGFLAPVGAMAYASTARFADDAESLRALRDHLEALVEERTQALTRTQEALHQSEKLAALGQFAAGVAHEVNNPAAVVTANLHYLRETAAEDGAPEEARASISEAIDAMQRINTLVRKLVDSGRLARAPAPADRATPRDVAVQVLEEARLRAGDRVTFAVRIAAAEVVAVRPEVLHQILSTLLTNAADAIPQGRPGRIEIASTPGTDGRLRIVVEDDGLGMSGEVLRRAFEPFFSTKGAGRGTGLGLPVARALAESHGGELRLESQPGQGTRAVLELPEVRHAA